MKKKMQTQKAGGSINVTIEPRESESRAAEIAETAREGIRATLALMRSKQCKLAVDGGEVDLEFNFRKLAAAEAFFQSKGHRDANLLFCLSPATLNVGRLQILIACAAHDRQPELSFEEAKALVTENTLYTCLNLAYDMLLSDSAASTAKDVVPA